MIKGNGRLLIGSLVAILAEASAQAQQLGGAPDDIVSLGRIFAALVLCVAAAVGLALVIKARSGTLPSSLAGLIKAASRADSPIEVVASRRLSIHAEIHIVRCRQTEYVLLCGASGHEVLERRSIETPSPTERPA